MSLSTYSQHAKSMELNIITSRSQKIQKSISFASIISVREYSQTLGDNPYCLEGAPITLGWSFRETNDISFEEYERLRQRRMCNNIILDTKQRRMILIKSGVSLSDILRAEKFRSLKMNCTNGNEYNKKEIKVNPRLPHVKGSEHKAKLTDKNRVYVMPQKQMVSRAA